MNKRPRTWEDEAGGEPADELSLGDLYSRPGFLLRRAHQISVALFLEETQGQGVTVSQYGALYVLSKAEGVDIVGLGRRLGMDRSTSALVAAKLEAAGWAVMDISPTDRRRKVLRLTAAGQKMLEQLSGPAVAARERLLSAFAPEEAEVFLKLLDKFVATFNGAIRTPIGGPP